MTNVSKNKLAEKVQEQLFVQFSLVFSSAKNGQLVKMFDALFTDAEKIMFVKRVAVVFLIAEDYSTYSISKTLKVSDATVRNLGKQVRLGKFDDLLGVTKAKSFDKKSFWQTVEVLLSCGLPPRGKGRWEWLEKHAGF